MAPIGNVNMVDSTGSPQEKMIEFYKKRAMGGTGLLITGLVPVSYGIDPTLPQENGIYLPRIDEISRTRLAGWIDLVNRVHPYGSKIFIQLSAGLGRVGSPEAILKGRLLKSSSWNKNFYIPQIPHISFTDSQIKKIVKKFGTCAVNAKVAGFDGIHIHGHEGYLMDQLTSDIWNKRKFGRYTNKYQFAIDVIREIKKRCGDDFPIIYRINLTHALEETYGKTIFNSYMGKKERKLDEGIKFCKILYELGVNAFDVDKGCYENWFLPHPPAYFDDAIYVQETAGKLKKTFLNENINIPIIAVGKIGKPEIALEILKNQWSDCIMLGRPLLSDPFWPKKVKENKIKEIIHCIGDHEGCIESFKIGGHPCCSVNAYTGFEDSKKLTLTTHIKKIAIIGAGPAGCEAAIVAYNRGHHVTLFEKNTKIGGQLLLASKMKIKHDIKRYLENLEYQIFLLEKKGLKLVLNHEICHKNISKNFDDIICCNGPQIDIPIIPGIEKVRNMEVRTFLDNDMYLPPDVKNVIVIGGGIIGCEIAYTLAYEKEMNVTLISKNNNLMPRTTMANRNQLLWMMMGLGTPNNKKNDFIKHSIKVYNASMVEKIENDSVHIIANKDRKNPYKPWEALIPDNIINPFEKKLNTDNTEKLIIDTDYIILATGISSNNDLYLQILKNNYAQGIYIIGDAKKPNKIWNAINDANEIARNI